MTRLTKEKKEEIIKLYNENVSKKEILEKMKISQSTFYRITKESRSEKTNKTIESLNESSNDNDNDKSN